MLQTYSNSESGFGFCCVGIIVFGLMLMWGQEVNRAASVGP